MDNIKTVSTTLPKQYFPIYIELSSSKDGWMNHLMAWKTDHYEVDKNGLRKHGHSKDEYLEAVKEGEEWACREECEFVKQPFSPLNIRGNGLDQLLVETSCKSNRLQKAIEIAVEAHSGETRIDGSPYILHPLRVMLSQEDEDHMIVAVLHDVLENSSYTTLADIRKLFGDRVAAAVKLLTHDKKSTSYEDYVRSLSINPMATKVKISDLEDNMNIRELSKLLDRDWTRIRKHHKAWAYLTKGIS